MRSTSALNKFLDSKDDERKPAFNTRNPPVFGATHLNIDGALFDHKPRPSPTLTQLRQWNISRYTMYTFVPCNLCLKTIGNRKGDCAWSCSRWQTQPEKICHSQRTNQCHSLCTLYWFLLCNFQIFTGCACHLELLHAQTPFLFPIVFGIKLIPFFDTSSVLAVISLGLFGYVLLYLGHCAVATVAVCGFGSCSLVFHCRLPRQISPLPPKTSQREVCSTVGESIRPSSLHNPTPSAKKTSYKFAAPRYRLPCTLLRWASNLAFQLHWNIAQSCSSHKD